MSAHCSYLSHCTWQVNWRPMKERGSGGNTLRHLRPVAEGCICLTHTHILTPNQLKHQTHTLELGQKYNSQTSYRSTIKQVGHCWDENVVNETNLLELLVTTAEQMTVPAHPHSLCKLSRSVMSISTNKIATDSYTHKSSYSLIYI